MPVMKNMGRKETITTNVATMIGGRTSLTAVSTARIGGLAHGEMTKDILHVDDRVIDDQPQREDQGEQGDAIDGVACQIVYQKCQGEGQRDGGDDNNSFAPTEAECDQSHDDHDGQPQLADQFIDFVVGRLAVVASDQQLNAGGDHFRA